MEPYSRAKEKTPTAFFHILQVSSELPGSSRSLTPSQGARLTWCHRRRSTVCLYQADCLSLTSLSPWLLSEPRSVGEERTYRVPPPLRLQSNPRSSLFSRPQLRPSSQTGRLPGCHHKRPPLCSHRVNLHFMHQIELLAPSLSAVLNRNFHDLHGATFTFRPQAVSE